MMIRNAPIAMPEPIAIRMPLRLGRTAPFSGTNPTSTTATSAIPSATYPIGPSRSPRASPTVSGTIAETTAVSGDRMLIGPIARHA